MLLALYGVLVYETDNTFTQDLLVNKVSSEGQELVENREYFFIEAVADV